MKSHFSAEFFKENRTRLRKLFAGTAPIVITANGLIQRSGDVSFPFRQDNNFWYLTGINEPDLILVIDKDKEYLILPEREEWRDVFEGPLDRQALSKRSAIKNIYEYKTGIKQLSGRLAKSKHVATILPPKAFRKNYGIYINPSKPRLVRFIKKSNPEIKFLDLGPQFIKMRSIKQPQELEAIKAAIDITSKAFKKLKGQLKKIGSEAQAEMLLTSSFIDQKAGGHAYPPIVAGGPNACIIHYQDNKSGLKSRDVLLIDAGAEVENYAADITRTYSLSAPTKRQQAVFGAVLEVQNYAKSLLKPGVLFKEYEQQVEHFMGEKLRELGLIKSISHKNVRKYYPHSTSHFLGLDVHDIGDYHQPLAEGMVITVEPGIYIKEEKIGVRLEDDVLITKEGIKVLSANLPLKLS